MHIYLNHGISDNEVNFTRTEAAVSQGEATITRRIYFEADAIDEDSVDILELEYFPQMYSVHPNHPTFKYYGNANIKPLSESSKIWVAELEYSTTSPNQVDSEGVAVSVNTKPWKLRPENITFSYPEQKIAFTESYNSTGTLFDKNGDIVLPVRNSAGDVLTADRSLHNIQMSFSYATKDWKISNSILYGNSINAKEITVCGLTIPRYSAILMPPESQYTRVYHENSTRVKWEYWYITINIIIDTSGGLALYRKMADIGNRAKFNAIDVSSDEMIQACRSLAGSVPVSWLTLPATNKASQICHFRLTKQTVIDGKYGFVPFGKLIFCSWEQYLYMRLVYMYASYYLNKKQKYDGVYDLNCEQDENMPLDGTGHLYEKAIEGTATYVEGTPYKTKIFREYPTRSWAELNLPEKGIKW